MIVEDLGRLFSIAKAQRNEEAAAMIGETIKAIVDANVPSDDKTGGRYDVSEEG